MAIDRFERGAQPLAPLAVERTDRAAQALDRLGQFGLLGSHGGVLRFGLFKFGRGKKIDRAKPLALRDQAVVRRGFVGRAGNFAAGEADAFGQERGRALKTLARDLGHFLAALVLVFSTRGQCRASFTR